MRPLNRKQRKHRKMLRRWLEAERQKNPSFTIPGMGAMLRWPTHSRKLS